MAIIKATAFGTTGTDKESLAQLWSDFLGETISSKALPYIEDEWYRIYKDSKTMTLDELTKAYAGYIPLIKDSLVLGGWL